MWTRPDTDIWDGATELATRDIEIRIDDERASGSGTGDTRAAPDLAWMQPLPNAANRHADRHGEPGHDVGPAVAHDRIGEDVFERRNLRRHQVLREHGIEIDAGTPVDIRAHLGAGDGLVPERAVQATQDVAPLGVVVDDLSDHVQHAARLVVHVAGAFLLDAERGDDRMVIPDVVAAADDVLRASFLSRLTLGVQAF
ncbi:MAG TPA: hypothetical protein VH539_04720 [Gemmatimonadaceae bacterium]